LVIEYTVPAQMVRITAIVVGATNGIVTWTGGHPPFQLEVKASLSQTNWVPVGSLAATNRAEFPRVGSQQFFRVAIPAL
jgi:hypothetical protein